MDRTERFYKIDQLLHQRGSVSIKDLMEELEVSRATVLRDIEYLRNRHYAPIVWDASTRGYRFTEPNPWDPSYALPGLWFNSGEVHALLSMEHLLSNLQPGLLGPHIDPLRSRIRVLLDRGDHSVEEVVKRIRILHMAARPVEPGHFQVISNALLKRKRLRTRVQVSNETTPGAAWRLNGQKKTIAGGVAPLVMTPGELRRTFETHWRVSSLEPSRKWYSPLPTGRQNGVSWGRSRRYLPQMQPPESGWCSRGC